MYRVKDTRRQWMGVVMFASLLVASSVAGAGGVIYVDDDAPPGGNGATWNTAFRYLQDALAIAHPSFGISEVRIAEGVYRPDRSSLTPGGSGNRGNAFAVHNGIALRGGYAGTGTPDPDARDLSLYPAILSGDLAGDDLPGFVNRGDNSYHVLWVTEPGATVELDGLVVSGGSGTGPADADQDGAGLYVIGVDTLVRDCTFAGNESLRDGGAVWFDQGSAQFVDCLFDGNRTLGGVNADGGAVAAMGAPAEFTTCVFQNNSAWNGGAVYMWSGASFLNCQFLSNSALRDGGATDGTATFESCLFVGNTAVEDGGAVFDAFKLIDCTLESNQAQLGGAAYALSDLEIVDCIFRINTAEKGGAVYGGAWMIRDSLLEANQATGGPGAAMGGALYIQDTVGRADRCRFVGNTSDGDSGAIHVRRALEVTNCEFSGNAAIGNGGAVSVGPSSSPPWVIRSCTFANNTASGLGGAVYKTELGDLRMVNSILWDNSDGAGSSDVSQIHVNAGGVLLEYSCITGWSGVFGGTGNIGLDPVFADADGVDGLVGTVDDDLHLLPGSPCIDAGQMGLIGAPTMRDIDLQSRVSNCRIDIGADETAASGAPDCDGNLVSDHCQTVQVFTAQSGPLAPVDGNNSQSFTIIDPPINIGDVTLSLQAAGDLGHPNEWIGVYLNGDPIGDVLRFAAHDCGVDPDEAHLIIPAMDFRNIVEGGDAEFLISATSSVGDGCLNEVSLTVEYAMFPGGDCDLNGIPDVCQPDCDNNGVADVCEIIPALYTESSPRLTMLGGAGDEAPRFHTFMGLPEPAGDVTLRLEGVQDLGSIGAWVYAFENHLGNVFHSVECADGMTIDELIIPHATFQTLAPQGHLTIGVYGEDPNACNSTNWITIEVEMVSLNPNDLDNDGVLDVCQCSADLTGDSVVNVLDLIELLTAWGANPGHPADLNGDDAVDVLDLVLLLGGWGPC